MSPARTRKTTAKQGEPSNNLSDREVALPRGDGASDARVADATAPEDGATGAETLDDRIRRRAYELYCARNQSDCGPMEDWLEAERQLRSAHSATEEARPSVFESLGDDSASEARR
jgi:hypothetical protein